MEAITQIVVIPPSREILIHLPESATAHETAEIIVSLNKNQTDADKIALMREAAADPLYLADISEINNSDC